MLIRNQILIFNANSKLKYKSGSICRPHFISLGDLINSSKN